MKYKVLQALPDLPVGTIYEFGEPLCLCIWPAQHPEFFQEIRETLGNRARKARQEAKLNAKDIAKKIGTSASYVYTIEKSADDYFERNASLKYVRELKKLGMDL